MKKRVAKKGIFICRRQKNTDKSFSFRECIRIAYFEQRGKPAYVVRKRKVNNVIHVCESKMEALSIANFCNSKSKNK